MRKNSSKAFNLLLGEFQSGDKSFDRNDQSESNIPMNNSFTKNNGTQNNGRSKSTFALRKQN